MEDEDTVAAQLAREKDKVLYLLSQRLRFQSLEETGWMQNGCASRKRFGYSSEQNLYICSFVCVYVCLFMLCCVWQVDAFIADVGEEMFATSVAGRVYLFVAVSPSLPSVHPPMLAPSIPLRPLLC